MPSSHPIAVVIATRDRPALLDRCLQSIAEQSELAGQVVVVDDGSAEPVDGVVARHAGALPITLVRQAHRGVAAARNAALTHVDRPWLCVMDDDDLMLPDRIRDHRRHLESSDSDVSHGGWVNFDPERGEAVLHAGKTASAEVLIEAGLALTHSGMTLRTDLARSHPYAEQLRAGVDFDLVMRLVMRGARFGHCGSYVTLRRIHAQRIGTDPELQAEQVRVRRDAAEACRTALIARGVPIDAQRARAQPMLTIAPPPLSLIEAALGRPAAALVAPVNRRMARSADLLEAFAAIEPPPCGVIADAGRGAMAELVCPLGSVDGSAALELASRCEWPFRITAPSPAPIHLISPVPGHANLIATIAFDSIADAVAFYRAHDARPWLWNLAGGAFAAASAQEVGDAMTDSRVAALRAEAERWGSALVLADRAG
jgi:hypothetical protein